MMNEQDLKFFKMATASVLGILILLLITSIVIAFYAADGTAPAYQPAAYAAAPAQAQWMPLDGGRYEQQREQSRYSDTESFNVPTCVEPCKIRVEYGDKYFLPYPTHRYSDRYYYEDYPVYPHYSYSHYPNNQRFFNHRIIQSDYTY